MLRRGHRLPRRSESEIEQLRAAGRLAAQTLEYIEPHVQPGVSTYELDRLCFEYITDHGAYPSPLNYPGPPLDLSKPLRFSKGGFPGSICTSLNEVVCHGIPSRDQVLKEGDIINVDVTVTLDGWFGDTSKTFVMPGASDAVRALVQRTQECLYLGIRAISDPSAYRRLNQIGAAIHDHADRFGYGVVRNFVGHGIGDVFHCEPNVVHYRTASGGPALKPGHVFTIEPMINLGTHHNDMLDDGWTAVTSDGKPSAQFEHTMVVTDQGVEVLTARQEEADLPWLNAEL
ncbi:MAG: type I methionyl aminopeptidase [Myxococcota bacterium]|nr:type I methionyl aminopeptidase [Myxococcota bacterium]